MVFMCYERTAYVDLIWNGLCEWLCAASERLFYVSHRSHQTRANHFNKVVANSQLIVESH